MTTKIESNRAPLKSPPFSNIPDHWEPLIGYEFRVVNKDGTSALDKTGKPKIGRIDLYDLMILDAMRSYKERARSGSQKCFIEAEQLSIKIGMRGQPLKKVCNRVLQLMHIGFIRCTPEIYGPTDAVRLVWDVDTKFMEDTARGIDAKRKEARLLAVKNGDFSTGSIGSITLKEYLKEQIPEQSSEQLPKQAKKDSSEKITEQPTNVIRKGMQTEQVASLSYFYLVCCVRLARYTLAQQCKIIIHVSLSQRKIPQRDFFDTKTDFRKDNKISFQPLETVVLKNVIQKTTCRKYVQKIRLNPVNFR